MYQCFSCMLQLGILIEYFFTTQVKEYSLEEYGRNYFDLKVKKSTLFGKAAEPMTSDKMLCWASDAIKKPMCTLSSNDLNSGRRID